MTNDKSRGPGRARAGLLAAACLLWLASCSDDSPFADATDATDAGHDASDFGDTGANGPDLADGVDGFDATSAPVILSGPTLTMSTVAPLAGRIELETDRPTRLELEVVSEVAAEDGVQVVELPGEAQSHAAVVAGVLRAETAYTITVTAIDGEGGRTTSPTELTVEPIELPAGFPELELVDAEPSRMGAPLTLFNCPRLAGSPGGFLIIVDAAGEVVWLLDHPDRPADARQLPGGNILFLQGNRQRATEVDLFGEVVASWYPSARAEAVDGAVPVDTDSFHHEIVPMPDGGFAVLSSELVFFDDYPTSELDPTPLEEPAAIVGDVIVDFASDGEVRGAWSLLDLLDPYRVAYDSFGPFWNDYYADRAEVSFDWSHANAVVYDEVDEAFVVSLRHQDAVIKLTREGELVWILGPHDNWNEALSPYLLTPVGDDFEWPYKQHAPELTPGGLILFDNGVGRASPPDEELADELRYSRAVEYRIDEDEMEVEQLWEYGAEIDPALHSQIVGDADWSSESDTVLITFGGLPPVSEGEPSARIVEVTRADPPEIVFELHVVDDNPDGPALRVVYRAERIESLAF